MTGKIGIHLSQSKKVVHHGARSGQDVQVLQKVGVKLGGKKERGLSSPCLGFGGLGYELGKRTDRGLWFFLSLMIFLMSPKNESPVSSHPLSVCKPLEGAVGASTATGFPRRVIVKLSLPTATRPKSSVNARLAFSALTLVFFIDRVILVESAALSKQS
jgi:hypothetical protein